MATKIAEASQKGTRPIRPTTKTRPRAAAAVFVTAFIALFEWRKGDAWPRRFLRLGTAALQGLVTGAAVSLVFEKIFYVRLP